MLNSFNYFVSLGLTDERFIEVDYCADVLSIILISRGVALVDWAEEHAPGVVVMALFV